MKKSGPDLILMGIGAAVFILAFVATGRALRVPGSSYALSFGAVSVAGLALAAWAILRMWRRQDDAALMEAGMLSFIFFLGLHEKAPKGSPLALFAALLPLAPAALFAWSTIPHRAPRRRVAAPHRPGGARIRVRRFAVRRSGRRRARSRWSTEIELGLDGGSPRPHMRRRNGSREPPLPMKNRLRVLRAERDWSQADLAERLGVSRQTVNAIETGRYDPSLPLAFGIARVFGKLIEEVFEPDVMHREK